MATRTAHQAPVLFLGGLAFDYFIDFAVPESVRFTPTQNVVIHKFIGGARQLDILGQDDDTIKWSGLLLGPDASAKAEILDQMVIAGEPQTLTFGQFEETVVVKQVVFDYRGPALIDYAIECYVIQNGEDQIADQNGQAPIDAAGGVADGLPAL